MREEERGGGEESGPRWGPHDYKQKKEKHSNKIYKFRMGPYTITFVICSRFGEGAIFEGAIYVELYTRFTVIFINSLRRLYKRILPFLWSLYMIDIAAAY